MRDRAKIVRIKGEDYFVPFHPLAKPIPVSELKPKKRGRKPKPVVTKRKSPTPMQRSFAMGRYRPITDVWLLARPKLKTKAKYPGSFPAGFLQRARDLLGARLEDPVLHVCAGRVRDYPYTGFGPNDKTLDLDPHTYPDYLTDAREQYPLPSYWRAVLIDPPYSEEDAKMYAPGPDCYPQPNLLVRRGLEAVMVGGRVGILHYIVPSPPKDIPNRFVAVVCVIMGFNNRARVFTVFERLAEEEK